MDVHLIRVAAGTRTTVLDVGIYSFDALPRIGEHVRVPGYGTNRYRVVDVEHEAHSHTRGLPGLVEVPRVFIQ